MSVFRVKENCKIYSRDMKNKTARMGDRSYYLQRFLVLFQKSAVQEAFRKGQASFATCLKLQFARKGEVFTCQIFYRRIS